MVFFCHSNDIRAWWGCDCFFTFFIGLLSFIEGGLTLSDIYDLVYYDFWSIRYGYFHLMFLLRLQADLLALVSIGFAFNSIFKVNLKSAYVAYFLFFISSILSTIFFLYLLFLIIIYSFKNIFSSLMIGWTVQEFLLFFFVYLLFCNIAQTRKKIYESGMDVGNFE